MRTPQDAMTPGVPSGMVRAWVAVLVTMLPVAVAEDKDDIEFYIGAGDFGIAQKLMNDGELQLLLRSRNDWTGTTGYAGGTDNDGDVCSTDYVKKGHAEVVRVRIPKEDFEEFTDYVFQGLFRNGDRVDMLRKGPGYRAALGLPGGMYAASDILQFVMRESSRVNLRMVAGAGDEGDNFGQHQIYIYDSDKFPFHQAELHLQLRYLSNFERPLVVRNLLNNGLWHETSCPNQGFLGMLYLPYLGATLGLLGFGAYNYYKRFGWSIRKLQCAPGGVSVELTGGSGKV